MTRTAWITLRHEPPYRSGAFAQGFERLGFSTVLQHPEVGKVRQGDVVVTWNLSPRYRGAAIEAKSCGAALIVSENGYIQKHKDTTPYYALARDGHNGSGFWFVGAPGRWESLGHKFGPWRADLERGCVLLANQRGIGSELMRSPHTLVESLVPKLERHLKSVIGDKNSRVVVREHPGRHAVGTPLSEHLRGARAVVSWSSNVLNLATLCGIPSFRTAPYHVNDSVFDNLSLIGRAPEPDREVAFERMSWAQWSLHEISSGEAFKTLLQDVL